MRPFAYILYLYARAPDANTHATTNRTVKKYLIDRTTKTTYMYSSIYYVCILRSNFKWENIISSHKYIRTGAAAATAARVGWC